MRQWETFSIIKVDMAAKPEVLITWVLQKTETSFEIRNGVTKLAACTRLRPTAGDTIVC